MFAASKSGRTISAAATDPLFSYVPLLLETTSTNGQQNNTFLDSSASPNTLTRTGTPTQGSVTPYWPDGYWSNYLNGSSDYLSASSTTAFAFGSGVNFTVECWVYLTAYSSGGILGGALVGTTFSSSSGWFINSGQNIDTLRITSDASGTWNDIITVSAGNGLPLNQWTHIAFVRNGGTLTLYKNGVSVGSITGASAYNFTSPGNAAYIGFAQSRYVPGYISNVRIVKGTAVYTSAFTPPTTPLTAITNTTFLTCQSNRFKDNSTNNFAITATGTPRTQAFQPFSPTASYTAAAYGGSGYFNGSTDYLSTPSATPLILAGTSWTIECWLYLTSNAAADRTFISKRSNANSFNADYELSITSGGFFAFWTTTLNTTTYSVPVNAWTHLAVTCDGTNTYMFANGALVKTNAGITATAQATPPPLNIGWDGGPYGGQYFPGYISNVRIIKGQALSTVSFTPPTSPVTTSTVGWNGSSSALSGTVSFLTNFTNAGIYDASVQNNLVTLGNAQTSIAQYKWAPTSISLDGSGDYLSMLSNPALNFGSGSFTVEAWVYLSAQSGDYFVISATGNGGAFFGFTGGTQIGYGRAAVAWDYNIASGVSTGAWYHLAWSRSGTSMRIFVNGTQVGTTQTTSQAYDLTTTSTTVGSQSNNFYLNGYIQDLRITRGIGRYTANFPVPTAAFPTR